VSDREVDLGVLSPAERSAEYAPRLDSGESESHRTLRLQLSDQQYEAEKMAEWYEVKTKSYHDRPAPWEYVKAFAYWTARLALVRDRMERMGFTS
jgi:hypothetical protein